MIDRVMFINNFTDRPIVCNNIKAAINTYTNIEKKRNNYSILCKVNGIWSSFEELTIDDLKRHLEDKK